MDAARADASFDAALGADASPLEDAGGLRDGAVLPSDAGEPDAAALDAGCIPLECSTSMKNCGALRDGCGGLVNCGSCMGGAECSDNVCSECTGLCLQQTQCSDPNVTTSIRGTVFAPNGVDPLPGVTVYVPNGIVTPFAAGVTCSACGSEMSGTPLLSTTTATDGSFVLNDMPVGSNIPLVVQVGRWRRQFTLPQVTACVNNALPSTGARQLRLPRSRSEGSIPQMALVSGAADSFECTLRRIGVADSEFTNPSGNGRVHVYRGASAAGETIDSNTPSESALWSTAATLQQYDMVLLPCQGVAPMVMGTDRNALTSYLAMGGKLFASHYAFRWLNAAPLSDAVTWYSDIGAARSFPTDPTVARVDTSSPTGTLADWLQGVGATTTRGSIAVPGAQNNIQSVQAGTRTELWVDDAKLGTVPLQVSFDTPVGAAASAQCGRVAYHDFHATAMTQGQTFPTACAVGAMSAVEKLLEYELFSLSSCGTP